jgi:hypothetical protein
MNENRFVEIETKIAFQENTIKDLSACVSMGEAKAHRVVVFLEQVDHTAETGCYYLKHRTGQVLRDFLIKRGNSQPLLAYAISRVRDDVDLPAPFLPTRQTRSLRSICKDTPSISSGPPNASLTSFKLTSAIYHSGQTDAQ